MGLFTPKWMTVPTQTAALTDQKKIKKAAIEADDEVVRLTAIGKLEDDETLMEIILGSKAGRTVSERKVAIYHLRNTDLLRKIFLDIDLAETGSLLPVAETALSLMDDDTKSDCAYYAQSIDFKEIAIRAVKSEKLREQFIYSLEAEGMSGRNTVRLEKAAAEGISDEVLERIVRTGKHIAVSEAVRDPQILYNLCKSGAACSTAALSTAAKKLTDLGDSKGIELYCELLAREEKSVIKILKDLYTKTDNAELKAAIAASQKTYREGRSNYGPCDFHDDIPAIHLDLAL